jgi:PiT family inorganic phosphate transporter
MFDGSLLLILVLGLILAAEFVNGWTDSPNAIATVVSTRVLSPYQAVIMATVLNAVGAMSGTAVAATVGKDIVRPDVINLTTVAAAMVGIILWSTLAWYYGLPTSESHALIAGLTGAGLATAGPESLLWTGWSKVLIGIVFSTFLGFFGGLFLMGLLYRMLANSRPGTVRRIFGRLQILSAGFMAFSHGSNDGQKFIGVFTLALLLGGILPEFRVPIWVIVLCALTMGVGTAIGGWRIVKTMGLRLTKLEPVHGFAAETAAALTIELATRLGIPLSTTHTINTAIIGVGATRRFSAVRWGVTLEIVSAWILTFPICFAIGWVATKIFLFFG